MSASLLAEPEPHPVPRSQAPWPLKAESYLLFVNMAALPPALYHDLERAWAGEDSGAFEGGLGAVMIVRYSWTPVGAYDELMLIPGKFSVPQSPNTPLQIPKSALRVARIYVSQRTTMYNGRLNWNIPKHLARFSFSAPPTLAGQSPPASLMVQVYPPTSTQGDDTAPFFECTLTPWKWAPALAVNSRWVPLNMMHVQPPLPEPEGRLKAVQEEIEGRFDTYDVSKSEAALCVGTDRWAAFDVKVKVPRARGCWVSMGNLHRQEGSEGSDANGRYWPRGLQPWSFGAWCEEGDLEITQPWEWRL